MPSDDVEAAGDRKGLRYGLMVRSPVLRRWQADVIDALSEIDGVRPALLIVDDRPSPSRSPVDRVRRLGTSDHMLWDAYNNGWVARRSVALQAVDRCGELSGLDQVKVVVERRGFSEYFPPDVVQEIQSYDLDFILRFAFGIIRGSILDAARHGVWSFHHGDELQFRGSPPAFWEVVQRQPVSGAILQRLTDRLDGGVVLEKGWFRTATHSYVRNTDSVHLGSVRFPARVAARLLRDGELPPTPSSASTAPVYRRPKNAQVARFLVSMARAMVRQQFRAVTQADHWSVGLIREPIETAAMAPVGRVEWLALDQPGTAYAADPFLVPGSDPPRMLYERYDVRTRVGSIWTTLLDGSAPPSSAGFPVSAHASYPYCFQHEGHIYCLPQISEDGVPLFELVGGDWMHVGDLLPSQRLLDPTVLHHEGRWWLFGTLPGPRSLDQLHIWHSEQPTGPWTPHMLNPVKTDVRSARPAGTPFRVGAELFRPAQDCAEGYGGAVSVCRITRLDELEFAEEVVRTIAPPSSWAGAVGIHTISGDGYLTVVDSHRRLFDRSESRAELSARLSRVTRGAIGAAPPAHADINSRTKVLAIINALGEGGTERSLAELVLPLKDRGIDVTIAILRSRGAEGVEYSLRDQGVDIRVLPSGRRAFPAFRKLVRATRPDVIHSMLFDANMVARLSTIGLRVPILTSLVSTSYASERLATVPTSRWKLRSVQLADAVTARFLVDHFHAVSESVKQDAICHLGVRPVDVTVALRGRVDPQPLLDGDERTRVRAELGVPYEHLVLVNVGRHEHAKDQVTLVAAAAPILRSRSDAWLWIAGRDGNASDDLRRAIAEHEVEDKVLLLGHRSDVSSVLAAADVFAMTSRYEGLPGAVIEAMAVGLPVIASDIGPVHEVVDPACAVLAPAGDVAAFRDQMFRLLASPDLRSALGASGRRRFESQFTIGGSADAFGGVVERVGR